MKKEFGELSEFRNRKIEFFRSNSQKINLEVLYFDYKFGEPRLFIRFPNEDYYTEMVELGLSSLTSKDEKSEIIRSKNIWTYDYSKDITIFRNNEDLMINTLTHNSFLRKISINDKEMENVLSKSYLKLSDSVKKVEYLFKINEFRYFLVIYPLYTNHHQRQLFEICNGNVKERVIKKFDRYRDGGTTYITFNDDNDIPHILYSPTPFDEESKPMFENNEMEVITDDNTIKVICNILGIETEQKNNEK